MRLLAALHCRVAPPGARTAAELAVFLAERRRHVAVGWTELLGPAGPPAERVASSFTVDQDRLSLDLVMRVADALDIELTLVVDDSATPPEAVKTSPVKRTASRRPGSTKPKPADPNQPTSPPALPGVPASPSASPPPASPATPVAPTQTVAFAVEPLRPPRLGRYRDAPPERASLPPPQTWTPRPQTFPLGDALLPHLTNMTGEDWEAVYGITWTALTGAASLPARLLEGLGTMTANTLQRLRRPRREPLPTRPVPDLPEGWTDGLDVRPLMHFWQASRAPDYQSKDTWFHPDARGVRVGHIALDEATVVAVRLAAPGHPHLLSDVVLNAPGRKPEAWLVTEVPLEITIDGERRPFRHIHAGPVFGELVVGNRVFFIAAISVLIVVVEVVADTGRIVWGGRAEKLPEVKAEMKQSEPKTPTDPEAQQMEPKEQPVPATTASASTSEEPLPETTLQQSDLEARLAAMSRELDEERSRRTTVENERTALIQIVALAEQAVLTLRAELTAQADARRAAEQEVLNERQQRTTAEEERETIMQAFEQAEQMLHPVYDKLEAAMIARKAAELRALSAAKVMLGLSKILIQTTPGTDPELNRRQLLAVVELEERDGGEPVLDAARRLANQLADLLSQMLNDRAIQRVKGTSVPPSALRASPEPAAAVESGPGEATGSSPKGRNGASAQVTPPSASPQRATMIGRNQPCPCGSGKKHKRCCGRGT